MYTIENLYSILNKERSVIVYGAGTIASNLLRALCQKNYIDKVSYVVTKHGKEQRVEGKKVYRLSDIVESKDTFFLIAVHEVSKGECEKDLEYYGYKNHIWITPYIFDIYYGSHRIVPVAIKDIWNANKQWYVLTARYLAICDYYGQCENGLEIYKKILSFSSNEDTVRKRVKGFVSLIQSFGESGFDDNYPVSCLKNNTIVDGAHRVALSIYHGVNSIHCKVYDSDTNIFNNKIDNIVYVDKKAAIQYNLDEEVINKLENATQLINDRIYGD